MKLEFFDASRPGAPGQPGAPVKILEDGPPPMPGMPVRLNGRDWRAIGAAIDYDADPVSCGVILAPASQSIVDPTSLIGRIQAAGVKP